MSQQVTTHFVQQFTDGITHLAQQKMSRLRMACDIDPKIVGDRAFYDQLGQTAMSKRTSRHGDTEYTDTPHARRMLTLESWDVADLIDSDDKVQVLNDPTNAYSQAFAAAAGRTIDDVVIDALLATASTGQTGTGSETWPTTESPVIEEDFGIAASNMIIEKMIEAKQQMDGNEVPEEDRYMVMSANQLGGLLNQAEIQSIDYNTVRALVQGEINTFLGFTIIRSERLNTNGDGDRQCIAFQKQSIKLGFGINPRGEIDRLPTKRYSTQVFYEMRVGATRMDPYGVVEIQCTDDGAVA